MNYLFQKNTIIRFVLAVLLSVPLITIPSLAQDGPSSPPVPVEIMFGNYRLFFQAMVSKPFVPGSRLALFTIATFQTGYKNETDKLELAVPLQISYRLWRNFGAFAGLALNNKSGMHPVIGPQYVFAKQQLLIVFNGRYLLTNDHNLEAFAFVEYKPAINDKWSLYTKAQGLYSHNNDKGHHDRSFYYLRLGLQNKNFSFGPGINLDFYGPDKLLKDNYGVYLSWQFQ